MYRDAYKALHMLCEEDMKPEGHGVHAADYKAVFLFLLHSVIQLLAPTSLQHSDSTAPACWERHPCHPKKPSHMLCEEDMKPEGHGVHAADYKAITKETAMEWTSRMQNDLLQFLPAVLPA